MVVAVGRIRGLGCGQWGAEHTHRAAIMIAILLFGISSPFEAFVSCFITGGMAASDSSDGVELLFPVSFSSPSTIVEDACTPLRASASASASILFTLRVSEGDSACSASPAVIVAKCLVALGLRIAQRKRAQNRAFQGVR